MWWVKSCNYFSGCLQMILALSSPHVGLPPLAVDGPMVEGKKMQQKKIQQVKKLIDLLA